MEIQETTLPIFYVSRVFGLAPFLLSRNGKGKISEIKLSFLLCIYSVFVLITAVSLTFRFIILDASSKAPIRMKTATSKFVTTLDVCVVVGACACGAVSGIVGLRNIKDFNQKLKEIDRVLSLYTDEVKDKRRGYYMLIFVFMVMSGMIAMDLTSKLRTSKKIKTALETTQDSNEVPEIIQETKEIFVQGYFPFYVLYFMLMALQTQFAQTAVGLGRRYRRLNLAIQSAFPKVSIEVKANNSNSVHVIQVPSKCTDGIEATSARIGKSDAGVNLNHLNVMTTGPNNGDQLARRSSVHSFVAGKNIALNNPYPRNHQFLDRLALTHSTLGEAVGIVSSAFGFTILIMLASCLLHLVATSYFLFVEILGENDIYVASLQLLWCVFHTARLLLIVEPCHKTSNEAGRTIIIICDIVRNCKEPSAEFSLEKFWNQLLADKTFYFSACSMCRIDRQILTSFSGAIATYLVILIQFQKTDG